MNERIKELALQAGVYSGGMEWTIEESKTFICTHKAIERFANLVVAQEREECAKVCDDLLAPDIYTDTDKSMWDITCTDCAAAIRARGNT